MGEACLTIAGIVVRACLAGSETLNAFIVEVEGVRCFAGQARGRIVVEAFRARIITSNILMTDS